jgi:hypothetical protein
MRYGYMVEPKVKNLPAYTHARGPRLENHSIVERSHAQMRTPLLLNCRGMRGAALRCVPLSIVEICGGLKGVNRARASALGVYGYGWGMKQLTKHCFIPPPPSAAI